MNKKIVDARGNDLPTTLEAAAAEVSPATALFNEIFMNQAMFGRSLRLVQGAAHEIAARLGMPEDEAERAVSNPDHPLQANMIDPMMALVADLLELSFNEMIQHAEFADRADEFARKFKVVSALPDAAGNGIPVFAVGRGKSGKPWKN